MGGVGKARALLTTASIAVVLLTISLIASVSGLRVELGEAKLALKGDAIGTSVPFAIVNRGAYDVEDFSIEFVLVNSSGAIVTSNNIVIPLIAAGHTHSGEMPFDINVTGLVSRGLYYNLFHDDDFELSFRISYKYGSISSLPLFRFLPRYPLVGFTVEGSSTMAWSAPLKDLHIDAGVGEPLRSDDAVTLPVLVYVSYPGALHARGVPLHVSLHDAGTGDVIAEDDAEVDLEPGMTRFVLYFTVEEEALAEIDGLVIRVETLGMAVLKQVRY